MSIQFEPGQFAESDEVASSKASAFETNDPFPSVAPGLLSSAEIDDYARLTGLIYPYDQSCLKSASYEMYIGGDFIYWDEKQNRVSRRIDRREDRYVVLPQNSIAFVQVEPTFRLPNYIAVRFNLRITHVHRGLLLGTGPLVDPGFHGKLLIPLHNLTAQDYYLDTQKALIWVEFTKTTYGCIPAERDASPVRNFKAFPVVNRNLTSEEYLYKARGGQPITSSIAGVVATSGNAAAAAAESANQSKTFIQRLSWGAALAIVLSTIALIYNSWNVLQSVQGLISGVVKDQSSASERLESLKREVEKLEKTLADRVSPLEKELEQLRNNQSKPRNP
ncbi:MAG: hypothetical protein KIT85_07425 [Pseudolabrys sp.]|nr:hypothetical protein [Pseudolabrys sp.]